MGYLNFSGELNNLVRFRWHSYEKELQLNCGSFLLYCLFQYRIDKNSYLSNNLFSVDWGRKSHEGQAQSIWQKQAFYWMTSCIAYIARNFKQNIICWLGKFLDIKITKQFWFLLKIEKIHMNFNSMSWYMDTPSEFNQNWSQDICWVHVF